MEMDSRDSSSSSVSVLMFPWLAHGHISPFLELSKKLTTRNFHVFFCSTPINLISIKPKLSPKYTSQIEFVELNLPSLPDLPPHYHTTNGLPPHLMPTLKRALDMSTPTFSSILSSLNPDLLIYDFLQPWAPSLALSLGIPAVEFMSTSAAMNALTMHSFSKPTSKFPFPEISLRDYEVNKFKSMFDSNSMNHANDKDRVQQCSERSRDFILLKTFEEIEGRYVDYFSGLVDKKVLPVGPLVEQDLVEEINPKTEAIGRWLDKKTESSSVFVSFGSEYFLSREEMEEIAHGLELSRVNFIWVIRFPVGETHLGIQDALPKGFIERVRDRGMVVEGWAPQMRILRHSSIGGFVSHCGWSSVMESMTNGVPIIAMPMHLDQPLNARVVEKVGVGMDVKRDKNGRVGREEVARVIRQVMVGKNGVGVRKRARDLAELMKKKGDEEIDDVVRELVQLSRKRELKCVPN